MQGIMQDIRRSKALAGLVAVAWALSFSPTFGQTVAFPEAHSELLGGASYAALFGHDQEALSPEPASSSLGTLSRESSGSTSWKSADEQLVVQVGPNVRVNDPQQPFPNGLLGRSETAIATDEDGERIVVGFNDAQGFCGAPFGGACTPQSPPGLSGFAFSTDGGLTFTDGGAPRVINHVFTRGDPWLDTDKEGKVFFYANLAVHDVTGAGLGISVHRGRFNDGTFAWNDVHTFNAPNAPRDFYDKEAIAVDKEGGRFAVVSVTNFKELCGIAQNGFGQIEVWHTNNGGNTWLGPVIAGPESPDSVAHCGNEGTLQQSSVPAIGPDREVFVAWQLGPTFNSAGVPSTNAAIVVARSLDGGVSFDPPVTVATINSMRRNPPVGYNRGRINDHPRIAVARSGWHRGRVFVVFYSAVSPVAAASTVQSLVSSQVFISFSDDLGHTWSTPTPVAPAVPTTGVKRFWPVVNLVEDDRVGVVYYESRETPTGVECNVSIGGGLRRRGPASSLVNTFVVVSGDRGRTFSTPVKVSSATSNWCTAVSNIRPNFGDYISSAPFESGIAAAWADGRNGVPDTFFAPIQVREGLEAGSP